MRKSTRELNQMMEEQILPLFGEYEWREIKWEVDYVSHEDDPDAIRFTLSAMYEAPSYRGGLLETLIKLCKITGKQEADDTDRGGYGGCETCDYGSSYYVEWTCWRDGDVHDNLR